MLDRKEGWHSLRKRTISVIMSDITRTWKPLQCRQGGREVKRQDGDDAYVCRQTRRELCGILTTDSNAVVVVTVVKSCSYE